MSRLTDEVDTGTVPPSVLDALQEISGEAWRSVVNILNNEGDPFPEPAEAGVAHVVANLVSLADEALDCCTSLGMSQQVVCLEHHHRHGTDIHLARVPSVLTDAQVMKALVTHFHIELELDREDEWIGELYRVGLTELDALE